MTNPTPDEQPRYFTIFDLVRHLILVGPTCGSFYLGLSLYEYFKRADKPLPLGGCCCGFGLALVAHFAVLGVFAALARQADKEDTPPGEPPNLE